MTGSAVDLTGNWTGIYNCPSMYPPTPFEAKIRDHGGLISGITTEPGFAFGCSTMQAMLEGGRKGVRVRFTKTYDDLERAPDSINYEGEVQPGGDEISGRWTIPGVWSGTFIMIRAAGAKEEKTRRVEVCV